MLQNLKKKAQAFGMRPNGDVEFFLILATKIQTFTAAIRSDSEIVEAPAEVVLIGKAPTGWCLLDRKDFHAIEA